MTKRKTRRQGQRRQQKLQRRRQRQDPGPGSLATSAQGASPAPDAHSAPDLGPAAVLLDHDTFIRDLRDNQRTRDMSEQLLKLLKTEPGLMSLRFSAARLSHAERLARLDELAEIEDEARRLEAALERALPLLVDADFRRQTLAALDQVATAKVASLSPQRIEDARIIAFGRLLASNQPGRPLNHNPLWRAIAVLSFQEAGAVIALAQRQEGTTNTSATDESSKPSAEEPESIPDDALGRAMSRLYVDRYRKAALALEQGEIPLLPLYRLLHLSWAYGRSLRRAQASKDFGLAPEETTQWLAQRVTDCIPLDLDDDYLARQAEAIFESGKAAHNNGHALLAERLGAAHGFLTNWQGDLGDNPFIRLHYFESLRRLLETAAAEVDQGGLLDACHAHAAVSAPDSPEPLSDYAAALHVRGEKEAAARVETFLTAQQHAQG